MPKFPFNKKPISKSSDIKDMVKSIIGSSKAIKNKEDLLISSEAIRGCFNFQQDTPVYLPLIEPARTVTNLPTVLNAPYLYQYFGNDLKVEPVSKPQVLVDKYWEATNYTAFKADLEMPVPKNIYNNVKNLLNSYPLPKGPTATPSHGLNIDKNKVSVTGLNVKLNPQALNTQEIVLESGSPGGGKSVTLQEEVDKIKESGGMADWHYLTGKDNFLCFDTKWTAGTQDIQMFREGSEVTVTLNRLLFHQETFSKQVENALLNLILIPQEYQPLLTIEFTYRNKNQHLDLAGDNITQLITENCVVVPDLCKYEIDLKSSEINLQYLAILEPEGYLSFINIKAFAEYENYRNTPEYKYSISGTQRYQTSVRFIIDNLGRAFATWLDMPFKQNFIDKLVDASNRVNMQGNKNNLYDYRSSANPKLIMKLSDLTKDPEVYKALYNETRGANFIYKHTHIKQFRVWDLAGYFKDGARINNQDTGYKDLLDKEEAKKIVQREGGRAIKLTGRL